MCPQISTPKVDSGKEPKLHQVTEWRKKPLGGSIFSLGISSPTNEHGVIMIQAASQFSVKYTGL